MAIEKRIKILIEAEINELYNPPALNIQDQRFYFALNDIELAECKKIRERNLRCMFVLLLGYFKVKPVTLSPKFHQIKNDLKFIGSEVFPGPGFRPFNISRKIRARLYKRVFSLLGYQRWENTLHGDALSVDLIDCATSWVQPRSLLDRAIEYLSAEKIAIPGYTTLQYIISNAITTVNSQFTGKIECNISSKLSSMLLNLANDDSTITLSQMRNPAKRQLSNGI